MLEEDPMKLIFEGLQMKKWNSKTDRLQRVNKKWGYLCSYHVYFQSYGH